MEHNVRDYLLDTFRWLVCPVCYMVHPHVGYLLPMKLYEILVPTIRNDGRPYRTRYHRGFDAKVRATAGGLTIMPATIKGQWIADDGTNHQDRCIPVRIMCTPEQLTEILEFTLDYYDQEAIFWYMISDTCGVYTG